METISTPGSNQRFPNSRLADIVIVNWNAGKQLHDCLSSIEDFGGSGVASVIVIDNGSIDFSVDELEPMFDLSIKVIRNRENLGFATACNQGAAVCTAPYILFLNPDTRLFDGTLSRALSVFDNDESAKLGIVGVQLVDEEGVVSRTCARFPRIGHFFALATGVSQLPWGRRAGFSMKEWLHDETRIVDEVMGAFFLVRRRLLEDLGGFDERFFVYFEEVDFSLRARQAGFHSLYLSEARAFHAGGGTSRQVKAHRLFYSLRSRMLYGFKHFPLWQAWVLVGLTCLVEPGTRLGFCLLKRDWQGIGNTLKGYRMLWSALPAVLRQSREAS